MRACPHGNSCIVLLERTAQKLFKRNGKSFGINTRAECCGIRKEDSEIGAFLTPCEERALTQAARIDQMAAEGQPLPPLAGVPIAIKDVMVTNGVRTTAGSKILYNFIPPYDCTAVARLEAAGAVILGKLNCD